MAHFTYFQLKIPFDNNNTSYFYLQNILEYASKIFYALFVLKNLFTIVLGKQQCVEASFFLQGRKNLRIEQRQSSYSNFNLLYFDSACNFLYRIVGGGASNKGRYILEDL